MSDLAVTAPERVAETVETHRAAFAARGLEGAWERVLAVVVQPGVDFSHEAVRPFDPAEAAPLADAIARLPGTLVYEAHSTDYQTGAALAGLVDHRFAILKVGPEVTFALREGILALSLIEERVVPAHRRSGAVEAVLAAMDADPRHWRDYYRGAPETVAILKLFSYSDRIRYYWGVPPVARAVTGLLGTLAETGIPGPLVSQFFPHLSGESLGGRGGPAATLLRRHIQVVAERYHRACGLAAGRG
jgi:D-tagatose-1,6-bisphosphate aldolase subunit GatZ/KbaZ